ncbi:class I SAM-dependent methyltransferase [Chelativorans alearense]|uniref:class I SAM-dependent methyltransferase n=1 Tax=Chelativorans alearense TaxID=2681495 RepID=UPI0013D8B7C9|nr:class I SAM-dependent methyltransferase [Chelativorans alearense]
MDIGVKQDRDKTPELFDSYGDNYSETVNRSVAFTGLDVDFFTHVKAAYILDLCRSSLGPPDQVRALDVGCGVGNFHGLLAPSLGSLSGVDVSSSSIERAKQRHPSVDYQAYDGRRLPYDDGAFDLAFTVCVMHHVDPAQWAEFASEMRRVLRAGGLALVFEHNPRNPLTLRAVNNCPFDEDAVLLRAETTAGLFTQAGFRNVTSRFILSVPAAGSAMRTLDRVFSRLPLGAQYYVRAEK